MSLELQVRSEWSQAFIARGDRAGSAAGGVKDSHVESQRRSVSSSIPAPLRELILVPTRFRWGISSPNFSVVIHEAGGDSVGIFLINVFAVDSVDLS